MFNTTLTGAVMILKGKTSVRRVQKKNLNIAHVAMAISD
jgi:hypothetical protein